MGQVVVAVYVKVPGEGIIKAVDLIQAIDDNKAIMSASLGKPCLCSSAMSDKLLVKISIIHNGKVVKYTGLATVSTWVRI